MLTLNNMSKHVDRLTCELNKAREKLRTIMVTSNSSDDSETENATKTKPSQLSTSTSDGQSLIDVDDNITEEMVECMEEKLEIAQSDQKNLFLIIFQVIFKFYIYGNYQAINFIFYILEIYNDIV